MTTASPPHPPASPEVSRTKRALRIVSGLPDWPQRRPRWQAILLMVAICLASTAALLDDFLRVLRANDLAVGAWDTPTHYLRMLHARELYLSSGHRFGWDPFWFQGYVPFLLYPHLTYVGLAALSFVVPVEPARIFNAYILAIYYALPLVAGVAVLGRLGAAPAAVMTAWVALLSSTAAGLTGVFLVGLLSQQAGVILFTLFAADLVIARRPERAAIWLGLAALVHVHTFLVASFLWACVGVADLLAAPDRRNAVRQWLTASVLACGIAIPALVGLAYGWSHVGNATMFSEKQFVVARLLEGTLAAPQPTLLAMLLCLVASMPAGRESRRWLICVGLGVLLVALSLHKWSIGIPLVDRVLSTMLFIRTLPFAFVWLAFVAIARWQQMSQPLRAAVVVLSLAAILIPRHEEATVARKIGTIWKGVRPEHATTAYDYRRTLRWIRDDAGDQTATIAAKVPSPHSPWLVSAVRIVRQPMLSGHGYELTSINNHDLLHAPLEMSCGRIRRQVQDYAVGYLVGMSTEARARFELCLERPAAFVREPWWVVATGHRWDSTPAGAVAFHHDPTWTNLEWELRPPNRPLRMQLPIVNNTNWHAEVDGAAVSIETTDDRMMQVTLPTGSRSLRLEYQGYSGEWLSVAAGLAFLALAVTRAKTPQI